jgi:AcrR family transcriptional regulator
MLAHSMQAAPAPTRQSKLDAATIVSTACALADREGPSAVTMRRLGAELGVDPTAVYRHFRSKQELLDAMADHLFEQLRRDFRRTDDPRTNLRETMLAGFRLYRSHPGLAVALARQRDESSALAALADLVIGELRAVGVSDRDAAWAYHTIVDVIVGTGLFHSVSPEFLDPADRAATRRAFAALPPETHPHTVTVAAHLYPDAEDVFRFTVELLLDAIELRAAESAAETKEGAG